MSPYTSNLEHLHHVLQRLDLLLERAVQQFRRQRSQDLGAEFQGFFISDTEIDRVMDEGDETQSWQETKTSLLQLEAEIQQRVEATPASEVILRFPYLCSLFGLAPFEADVLLLALAPELALRYQKLYAYLQDDVTRKRPSVDLAMRLFYHTAAERVRARAAFSLNSPLLDVPLLTLHDDPSDRPLPLLARSFKLDDRMAEFLLDSDRLDPRLTRLNVLVQRIAPQQHLSDLVLPKSLTTALQQVMALDVTQESWLCLLQGVAGVGKQTCAEAIAGARQRSLLVLDIPAMLQSEFPFQTVLTIAFREAQLYHSVVYLKGWHELLTEETRYRAAVRLVEQKIERYQGLVLLGSHTPWQPTDTYRFRFIPIEVPLPDERSRYQLWQQYLGQQGLLNPEIDLGYLASTFRFSGGQIQRAIAHAKNQVQLHQGNHQGLTQEDLLGGCRLESNRHLVSFARKVKPQRTWSDLVLPKDSLTQLKELCQQVRYRRRVYTDWGFDQKLSLGKGSIALFTGDSGTGKTLSAEILAHDLGLDLFKVDLSLVVSKYIGETEKNLSRVFQEAQESNAILFFDEADALFGKRSEVKDAHDRYANIEINYLLQRVEEYEGIIILASNLSKNIDPAFVRRLHFSIEFPFPDQTHRLKIWQGLFPDQAPLSEEVDFEFLARKFKMAGGNIKNVALAAAFHAADNGGVIGMPQLMLGMKREYQKLGRVCERTDFEQYYEWVR